jgi:molybdate transport system substrate-binding protein
VGKFRGRRRWRLFRALAVFFFLNVPANAQDQVFVAASLNDVMGQIAQNFTLDRGIEVRIISAASSTLAKQIGAGAPADIFVSANRDWLDYVHDLAAFSDGVELFSNRLVVISLGNFTVDLDELQDLASA